MNLVTRNRKGAPLSAADHDSNMFGVQAGVRNVLQDEAPADGITDARASIAKSDVAATAGSLDLYFSAGTYRIASDITIGSICRFAKGAKLRPDSGVTITLAEGYFAGDWQHVFDISAGGQVTATAMPSAYVTPQHFGALANAVNNDSPAIQAAANFAALTTGGHASFEIRYPIPRSSSHWYRLEQTVYAGRCAYHRAMVPVHARNTGAVRLRPVDGLKAAMVFMGTHTSVTTSTEFMPGNPPHDDPWVAYERNTTTGFVNVYICKVAHTSAPDNRPGQGANWPNFWIEVLGPGQPSALVGDPTLHAPAWSAGVAYKLSPGFGVRMIAGDSHVEGLMFEPLTAGAVKFGVVHTCPMHFTGCVANKFEQAGFASRGQSNIGYTPLRNLHLKELSIFADIGVTNSPSDFARLFNGRGPVQGGVNGSSFTNCHASNQTNGHGFYAEGNVAGIVRYDNCDAQGNSGAGFMDNTSVGCNYLNCHSAQNTWKINHRDVRYMCIKGHNSSDPATEPGVGADWRRYWTEVASSVPDASWAAGVYYIPAGGVNVALGTLGYANIINHYTEGGIERGVVPRSRTTVIGGLAVTNNRVVYHPEFENALVIQGTGQFMNSFGRVGVTDPWGTPTESGFWVGNYATNGSYESPRIYSFGDERDDASSKWTAVRLAWSTTTNAYVWTLARLNKAIFAFTGRNFNNSGYSGADNEGLPLAPAGILVGNGGSSISNLVKVMSVNAGNLAAATSSLNGQPAARGQRWYYTQPSPGGREGVVCTTGGSVGSSAVLKEFGSVST